MATGVLAASLLVVAIGLWFFLRPSSGPDIKHGQYQAVFLTNGQVYFGKYTDAGPRDNVTLSNIYYLQSDSKTVQPADKQADAKLSLVKLGSELHGPEDTMFIKRNQILFWENLKNDSQVVKSINAQAHQ